MWMLAAVITYPISVMAILGRPTVGNVRRNVGPTRTLWTGSDCTFDSEVGTETEDELMELTGSKVAGGAQWSQLLGI